LVCNSNITNVFAVSTPASKVRILAYLGGKYSSNNNLLWAICFSYERLWN